MADIPAFSPLRFWLRIGVVYHNLVRGPENDDENLRDVDDFRRFLAAPLNLVLHGHTHFGSLNWLNQHLPVIGAGSLLVRDREGRFSFVHGSVMEWLVAGDAATSISAGQTPQLPTQNEISPLMAGFVLGLAGPDRALSWAWDVLSRTDGSEGWLKKNALLIQQRHQERQPAAAVEPEHLGPANGCLADRVSQRVVARATARSAVL